MFLGSFIPNHNQEKQSWHQTYQYLHKTITASEKPQSQPVENLSLVDSRPRTSTANVLFTDVFITPIFVGLSLPLYWKEA